MHSPHVLRRAALLLATASLLPAHLALAAEPDSGRHASSAHDKTTTSDTPQDGEIVVSARPPVDFGILASSIVLEGDELLTQTRGQIGDTLARLPGVSATSFSPGASRPVLRGMDGDRIRVLIDGIGSLDASSVSADHAVVLDPLTIDHIDILHGPAVLLFGGQAIGGAVNAQDKRIPRVVPDAPHGTAIASYGSAADERSVSGAAEVPISSRFAFHADASWRKSNDLRVGGYVNSSPLRSELLDEAAEHREAGEVAEATELEAQAALSGRIPNSAAESSTLGAGVSFIDSGGNLGISVQRYDTHYGVPARPGDDQGEEGNVAIDLGQTRVDLRGALNLGGVFDSLQIRGAYSDYEHVELEGDEVGTRFAGNGVEARADLVQRDRDGWRGRSGIQYLSGKLTVRGDEAVFPDNQLNRFGIFTLQSVKIGNGFEIELAGRYERASVKSTPVNFDRSFDLWSGASGLSYTWADGWKIGVNYIHGARSPAPEELLSNGAHAATQAFEIGDPSFKTETSNGLETYVHYDGNRTSLSLTGYLTDFHDFITALPDGTEIEGLPVFRYTQLPALFKGFEASASYKALQWSKGSLKLDVGADYTHAQLKDVGPVPRIPPLRLQGGVEVEHGPLHLRGEVEWNDAQNRVADNEYPVPAFTLVNLNADWHPFGNDGPLTLMLAANNLFDVVGRRAASYTRDFVPLPGRDIRLTAKIAF